MTMKAIAAAALIATMTLLPSKKLLSQQLDTAKVKLGGGKELVLKKAPVKPHLTLKSVFRNYNSKVGAGIGLDAGLDVGTVSFGASFTGVKTQKGLEVEESSISAFIPLSEKIAVIPYAYSDQYFSVPFGKFAYGTVVKGYGVKLGFEVAPYKDADGYWCGFAKVPIGSFTPFVAVAGWGSDGWQGAPQKMVAGVISSITQGKLGFTTDMKVGKLINSGKWTMEGKLTVSYTLF